ncbi:hypothetical protein GA0061070_10842 [Kosakonia oryziphila]|uniref:Uncharacterized protein n=1 Tax=Kosakonia oryziphila TaxID=1005667 RepID=A0A1C4GN33_9ENTR|nr:hypothetical protein GA0061070_10842 [Kosakonia oryziphila]
MDAALSEVFVFKLFLVFLRKQAFEAGNLRSLFTLTPRGRCLILQLTVPVVELRFIQDEFAGGCGNTNTFGQFKGFITEFEVTEILAVPV